MTAVLVDTNVLVYRLDAREPVKRGLAHDLLVELQPAGIAALSAQVLGEFFRVVTTRLDPRIPPAEAQRLVRALVQSFPTWPVDGRVVLEAARGVHDHRLSYRDAQLWATARLRGATVVLSEDFTDGRTVEGVTFRDPFAAGFALPEVLAAGG